MMKKLLHELLTFLDIQALAGLYDTLTSNIEVCTIDFFLLTSYLSNACG